LISKSLIGSAKDVRAIGADEAAVALQDEACLAQTVRLASGNLQWSLVEQKQHVIVVTSTATIKMFD
jgi:hypothetical protein